MVFAEEIDPHFGIRPQCGLCGASMVVSEQFSLLLGNAQSTSFSECLGPFAYPDYGHFVRGDDGIHLCRKPGCGVCTVSAEAATIHTDCLELAMIRCRFEDVMDQLWITAAWRSPWRQAPNLRLHDPVVSPDFSMLDQLGLSQMKFLPSEVIDIIHGYTLSSPFWRYCIVSDVARGLLSSRDQVLSVPLCDISAWNRCGRLERVQSTCQPIIRLTIDTWGIENVESLRDYPEFKSWRTDYLAYIILDRACVTGIIAEFMGNRLRLRLPKANHQFEIWDTPTPPKLSRCGFYPADFSRFARLKTVDLRHTFGLTFFYDSDNIYGIHAHTTQSSCALSTYRQFSYRRRQRVAWVYVPISRTDYIAAVGVRLPLQEASVANGMCLLFRMRLGGDVSVGCTSSKATRDLLFPGATPHTLIYSTEELRPISVFGTYATEQKPASPRHLFSKPTTGTPPFADAYFLATSLNNVECATVFNREETGYCIGILFEYKNGAKRSVGQCRVGLDPVERYHDPGRICLRRVKAGSESRTSVKTLLEVTMVQTAKSLEHQHSGDGWTCFAKQGYLEAWFSCDETEFGVVVD